jgi:hypothetical protein
MRMRLRAEITFEALAKLATGNNCHSERSEESRISIELRSFTPFRMTEKRVLQEALLAVAIDPKPLLAGVLGFTAGAAGDLPLAARSPPSPLTAENFNCL